MKLVERGDVWKFYHNEPLSFTDLKEEASFFTLIGHTEEVPNPANGRYRWTKEEALDTIREGSVHAISMDNGIFGSGPHISARVFHNKELGARVAKATLQGFGLVPVS